MRSNHRSSLLLCCQGRPILRFAPASTPHDVPTLGSNAAIKSNMNYVKKAAEEASAYGTLFGLVFFTEKSGVNAFHAARRTKAVLKACCIVAAERCIMQTFAT